MMIHMPFRKTISVLSVDATFGKTHKAADYVAIEPWGYADQKFFCYDSLCERMGFEDTCEAIRTMRAVYPCHFLIIEDAANGPAIIETLSHDFPNVVAVPPRGGKEARARAASHVFKAGRVFFNTAMQRKAEKLSNLTRFPRGRHDDDVDATSQAILWMLQEFAGGVDYVEAIVQARKEAEEMTAPARGDAPEKVEFQSIFL